MNNTIKHVYKHILRKDTRPDDKLTIVQNAPVNGWVELHWKDIFGKIIRNGYMEFAIHHKIISIP